MNILFCEECGGKNSVAPDMLAKLNEQPIICQICGNIMSEETIIPHGRSVKSVDTLHYHLLFIDDDLFHLQLMKTSMEKEYRVSIASTGSQGLELAEELLPDLILLDVNMPGTDGYVICRRLKDNAKTRKIPVLFVSAMAESDSEGKGFSVGAVDYIAKPINLAVLNARIGVQLRLKLLLEQREQQTDRLMVSLQERSLQAEVEQQNLLQEKNNFMSIVNSLQERVTIEDTEKRLLWANKAALEAAHKNLSDSIGRHCYEIHHNSSTVCEECPLTAGGSSELSVPVEISSPGQGSCLLQTHIPFFDDDGELMGIAHVVTETAGDALAAGAISSYLIKNRAGLESRLVTILFGIDAVSSMYRENKAFTEVSASVGQAAEQLSCMIHDLLEL